MENVFPGNLCVMKANIRHHQKKTIIWLYSLLYIAALQILNTRGGVILAMSFLDNINFLEALTAVLIVFHFSAHYQRSAL